MQVTITLLPASLSFVHIPRHRLSQLSRPIVKQIIQQNPAFLNITSNELEISIFSSSSTLLDDFEPVARRDRHRSRADSTGSQSAHQRRKCLPIDISPERWSVLQIDSHSEQLDNSGARVHELSAPLAAAGISILFQSSYMADFIFVKESRLQEVLTLLTSAGFDSYSANSSTLISPSVSPSRSPGSSPHHDREMTMSVDLGTNTVFTRSRKGSHASWTSMQKEASCAASSPTVTDSPMREKSYSPSSGDVRVLSSDLACVGLSDDHVDHWSLKIIKLVAYPELLPFAPKGDHDLPPSPSSSSAYLSSSEDEDAYFSLAPKSNSSASSLASAQSSPQSLSLKQLPDTSSQETPQATDNCTQSGSSTDTSSCKVPFFSFTRTPEGTSLTTDVNLLATLFPPSEREMVMGGGELDRADSRSNMSDDHVEADEGDESDDDGTRSTLKCLQIDLRKYGLDKYGLVNRYATILERNGINHMYSSTFKTANLLVDRKHATRAQVLLRSC